MPPSFALGMAPSLWVASGRFEFPVQIPFDLTKGTEPPTMMIDPSNGSGDGFFQFKAVDVVRVASRSWSDDPIWFDFRASVIAPMAEVKRRAETFVECCLDWFSLIHGVAASAPKLSLLYNEADLQACRAGSVQTFAIMPIGTPTFATTVTQNPAFSSIILDADMIRCMRFLRKAMLSTNIEDRFLVLFLICETLSRRIAKGDLKTNSCKLCGGTWEEPPHVDHAGFKQILQLLFPEDSQKLYKTLYGLRSTIAHGGKHPDSLCGKLVQFEPIILSAATASMATVAGMPPDSLRMINFGYFELLPIGFAEFKSGDPSSSWGHSVTDAIQFHKEHATPPPA